MLRKMKRKQRILGVIAVALGLLAIGGFLLREKAEPPPATGGLNPAVFAGKSSEESEIVYGRYQEFLESNGFSASNDGKVFEFFPRRIYPSSRQEWYSKQIGDEALLLQVDVSDEGFSPYLRWQAASEYDVENSAEKKGLEFAVKASEWMGEVEEENQVSANSWLRVRDEYALRLAQLKGTSMGAAYSSPE